MFTRVWSHLKPSEKPRLSRCQALASEEANRGSEPERRPAIKAIGGMLPYVAIVYRDLPLPPGREWSVERAFEKRTLRSDTRRPFWSFRVSRTENALCNWYVCLSSNRVFFRNVVAVSSHVKSHSGAKAWRARADAEIQHIKEDQVGESRGPTAPGMQGMRLERDWTVRNSACKPRLALPRWVTFAISKMFSLKNQTCLSGKMPKRLNAVPKTAGCRLLKKNV